MGEIVFRLRLSGLVLNCFESGEEQADQDRDDRDDDQQLDESEGAGVMLAGGRMGRIANRQVALVRTLNVWSAWLNYAVDNELAQ